MSYYACNEEEKTHTLAHNLRAFILFSISVHPFNGFNMKSLDSENRCKTTVAGELVAEIFGNVEQFVFVNCGNAMQSDA